jgi:restriction system protein
MAKRRADTWDDIFEALRWLFTRDHPAWSILVAAVFFFIPVIWFQRSIKFPAVQMLGYVMGAVPAIVSLAAGVAGWKLRQQRAVFLQQHLDIGWLNNLSWQDFERQVAEVYRQRGYQVEEVGGGGADGGVDLRLRRDGTTSIVQCKRWKTYKVGVKPVRELFGVMTAEKAGRALFITSGVYTDEALRFAEGKPLELVDGAQLAEMLRQFQQSRKQSLEPSMSTAFAAPALHRVIAVETPARPKCPRCASDMVLRRAKSGQHAGNGFWGCSTFAKTKCGGIRKVE